ncbi:hydrogenase nickel incorporation protein HypB [Ruminiclostridium sufflavum DSM 19573]|uniref:Hydrogenase nickel incorporation protein HypB n=1 Tax=Ruminiclostridium sufflavum DSM 19573 TaxID=1121337 RepID=A0A318XNP0_9FIRM|nr:hydrogenase nickel incorporation protein HypB [Ruminiclostridium sufflavum]PYG87199.1 hydrogenase nickel incorporation protein HypB [Ruminiclostridium sufflavum DSM 19573]
MEIKVMKNIMHANQKLAQENRAYFRSKGIKAVNIMASPGSGKTSTILKLIDAFGDKAHVAVVEGDIASSIDAEKIDKLGNPVIQINTGGGCHLDANMIKSAVESLALKDGAILFIENVGNLVCPSSFDLGEGIKMVIASVPEGHDKPYKYTSMFEAADIVVLNKMDLMPYIDFDRDSFYKGVKALNEKAEIIEVSCKTGEGIERLAQWMLTTQVSHNRFL